MVETFALWATILGSVLALLALAWAAVNYVLLKKMEINHSEFQRVFEIMDHLGAKGNSIASKMAAAYELRKYPQYAAVIVRLAEKVEYDGAASDMLKSELDLTAEFFKTRV
jgi:hypothetical protein